jgi:hypothetical protein
MCICTCALGRGAHTALAVLLRTSGTFTRRRPCRAQFCVAQATFVLPVQLFIQNNRRDSTGIAELCFSRQCSYKVISSRE